MKISRYIDADEFRVRINHYPPEIRDIAKKELRYTKTADVQPAKHGKWIIKDNHGTGWYRVTCSECGEDVTSCAPMIGFLPDAKVIWYYCPNCGARMKGEDDG